MSLGLPDPARISNANFADPKSFIPILKNNPSEAKIKSHQLMLRVGMIKQSSAGIYSWLPLGFKVMKKIERGNSM